MKKVIALAAVAGIASVANAAAVLDVQVSLDGSSWSNSVSANSGSTVFVRFIASFDNAYGWASTNCDLLGSNLAAGDTVGGLTRGAGFTGPGGDNPTLYTSGSSFRIGSALDPANNPGTGLVMGQQAPTVGGAPNPNFRTDNPALLFSYTITLGANFGYTIGLAADPFVRAGRSAYNVYSSALSTISSQTTGSTDGASINVVPAPGAVALLGLGALVAGRRRR